MIVVVGNLGAEKRRRADAATIAGRVAGLGERVEAVGVLAADDAGDKRLVDLRTLGVGHAAVLRTPADRLDAADLDLALRYLPDVGAIVLVEPAADLVGAAAAAATWLGAGLVIIASEAVELPERAPDGTPPPDQTVVLEPPRSDPDGAFAGLVAALAVRLAGGATASDAWSQAVAALGVERLGGLSGERLP